MGNDATTAVTTVFAFDFDGVLVDSAAETGHSGWLAAKILWPDATWMTTTTTTTTTEKDHQKPSPPSDIIERFRLVRPCLETGWEASLIVRLLADPSYGRPGNDEIIQKFHGVYKERILQDSGLKPETCNQALKKARDDWISQNNGQDWIQAHDFFQGACQAVRQLLASHGNENVFVITTKAKDFAIRLLEQQGLCDDKNGGFTDSSKLQMDHIYGLGSGPKKEVLAEILKSHHGAGSQGVVAIMVEDNLSTLRKIVAAPELKGRVLPVLASWGYNTEEQQQQAVKEHFVVLDEKDSSSLSRVLDPEAVPKLVKEFDAAKNQE